MLIDVLFAKVKYFMIRVRSMDNLFSHIKFNSDGLVAAIAVCVETDQVLMMAWMNEDSLRQTLETGDVCYWSRSRQCLWRKGETSGHTQRLESLAIDCDGDTILLRITQKGAACHTGRRSCFYRLYDAENDILEE